MTKYTTLNSRYWYYHPHFTEDETETLTGESFTPGHIASEWQGQDLSLGRLAIEPTFSYSPQIALCWGQDVGEFLGSPFHGSGQKEFISSTHTCRETDLGQDLFWTLVTVATKVAPRSCPQGAYKV